MLWIILLALFVFGMLLHFWYRYKTDGWTKSYGLWKYDKGKTAIYINPKPQSPPSQIAEGEDPKPGIL